MVEPIPPVNPRRMCCAEPAELRPVWWDDDGLSYVDQRVLPGELARVRAPDAASVIEAIGTSAVTGARCVDILGAFGVALARTQSESDDEAGDVVMRIRRAAGAATTHFEAFERVFSAARGTELAEALTLLEERYSIDRAIAQHALAVLPAESSIITHGSTGALSTGGFGTAVGAIIAAPCAGKQIDAYVSESRPLLTGLRLAAFELSAAGIGCTVFPDSAAAALMHTEPVAAVIVSAEAIAANGDAVAEVGTYAAALAAAHNGIAFYVTVPRAAIDLSSRHGDALAAARMPPAARVSFSNLAAGRSDAGAMQRPLFDITPGRFVTAIITEYGLSRPPFDDSLAALWMRPRFSLISRRS